MRDFTSVLMNQDVVSVSIAEADYIANHRPDGGRFDEVVPRFVPNFWTRIMMSEPISQNRLDVFFDLVPDLSVSFAHSKVLSLFLDFLHLTFYVVLLPIVSNNTLESVRVLDPFDQPGVSAQRHNCICTQLEVSGSSLGVVLEHLVAKTSKVNEPLFFPKVTILVALEQEVIHVLVCAKNSDLLRLFFAQHDRDFLEEP